MRDLLTANPHNLSPGRDLERYPELPALPWLGEISVPTLIVVGEHDIPDVHAHLPHFEVPEAFNRAVLDVLSNLPKPARPSRTLDPEPPDATPKRFRGNAYAGSVGGVT